MSLHSKSPSSPSRSTGPLAVAGLLLTGTLVVAAPHSADAATRAPSTDTGPVENQVVQHRARPRVKVKLTIPRTRVDARSKFQVKWQVKNRPARTRLVLQRLGTGDHDTWERVARLPSDRGRKVIKAAKIGKYTYSVAVQRKKGGAVVKRASRNVFAYAVLKPKTQRTTVIGGQAFVYASEVNGLIAYTNPAVFTSGASDGTCRWIDLSAGATPPSSSSNEDATPPVLTLSVTDAATTEIPMEFAQIYETGPVKIAGKAYAASYTKDYGYFLYLNAKWSCWTENGLRP